MQAAGAPPPEVLVVDDSADIREMLAEVLSSVGYRVRQASNGHEALVMLQRGLRPSVILLDLRMPVMDGASFREAQSRDAALSAIPVVVMSAEGAGEPWPGVTELRKPFDVDQVVAEIEALM